ncbi:Crp/Fnr family transcriptional regulator [Chryseobacterium sp. SIMBA_029]|uniref:Crp/Fnr family transcriptional regulator n=1 Tax=Chryseobacterium sp. SIMBA_029 TaxID=3085772 RepID=UPI00397E3150
MIIDENLLKENGASYEYFAAKDTIFKIGDLPNYYMQIVDGIVELNNYHEDGKEVTLNILISGQAIGESLLFSDHNYLMNAIARTECKILKLTKFSFMQLLQKNNDVVFNLFRCLSDRLCRDYVMLFNNSSNNTLHKVQSLLDYYKRSEHSHEKYSYPVPLTRQQIANLLGMRVETVIRTVKKLEDRDVIKIRSGKIYY